MNAKVMQKHLLLTEVCALARASPRVSGLGRMCGSVALTKGDES